MEADTAVPQTCSRAIGTATYIWFGHVCLFALRRSRTVETASSSSKHRFWTDSYIAMTRKAEYPSHPPPARGGGGGGAAATAADTSAGVFAICLTRGVRSKTTPSPVCRVHAQAYVKLFTERRYQVSYRVRPIKR